MVEPQPSKLIMRVRFPLAAPDSVLKGFGPCSSVVEHSLGKGEVACSIHAMGTKEWAAKSKPVLFAEPVTRALPAHFGR